MNKNEGIKFYEIKTYSFFPKMIFLLHFVTLQLVKFKFQLLFGTNTTTLSSSSPFIHAIINQKTNQMTKGVNQYCLFFECYSIERDEALRGRTKVHIWSLTHINCLQNEDLTLDNEVPIGAP